MKDIVVISFKEILTFVWHSTLLGAFSIRKEGGSRGIEYRTKQQKKRFYNSSQWKALRQKALERDNYECQECKRIGKVHVDSVKVEGERKSIELNVHHIKEIEFYPELALVLANLETLCLDHHNEKHPEKGFSPQEPKWNDERW